MDVDSESTNNRRENSVERINRELAYVESWLSHIRGRDSTDNWYDSPAGLSGDEDECSDDSGEELNIPTSPLGSIQGYSLAEQGVLHEGWDRFRGWRAGEPTGLEERFEENSEDDRGWCNGLNDSEGALWGVDSDPVSDSRVSQDDNAQEGRDWVHSFHFLPDMD